MTEQQGIIDESHEWRCTCAIRPLLARFGPLGGVHVHVSGKRSYALNYVFDVQAASLTAHCPACHEWRELYWDAEQQTVATRKWTGFIPVIDCRCEFERFAREAAARRQEEVYDHAQVSK